MDFRPSVAIDKKLRGTVFSASSSSIFLSSPFSNFDKISSSVLRRIDSKMATNLNVEWALSNWSFCKNFQVTVFRTLKHNLQFVDKLIGKFKWIIGSKDSMQKQIFLVRLYNFPNSVDIISYSYKKFHRFRMINNILKHACIMNKYGGYQSNC